jgi:hypothetical protein
VGELDQDSGAVTRVGLGALRAPVPEVDHDLETLADDLVGPAAVHVDHEADTTGVVFEAGVVEAPSGPG